MAAWEETLFGAGTGAAGGAAVGSMFGPVGTGIGGVAGGLLGGLGGYKAAKAKKKQKQSLDAARKQMAELQRAQYAQRMADMDRAMSYFAPVDAELKRLYHQQGTAPAPMPDHLKGVI